jgi:N6-adenosine-specific RNA methylase IME4
MNELSTITFFESSHAIATAFPEVTQRYQYKKLLDVVKAMKGREPEVIRADIEVQASLADAIDEAMASGEATQPHRGAFQVGRHEIAPAEVDRWRKLRAIPESVRNQYYTDIPKPSRAGLFRWYADRCVSQPVSVEPESPVNSPKTTASLGDLPRGHFGCVYADPPWQYGNQGTRAATDNHYGTMSIDDLCEMPVSDLVADDAHLHLWTTNAFVREAFRLIDAWGFEYRSMFVWVKPQMGIGNYWRVSHEIMLLGIRGNAKRFNDKSLKSWVEASRTKHSAKPESVRGMIEKASHGPYLELFGRQEVPGWTVFGNQISGQQLMQWGSNVDGTP